jgi:hypothetical protein
MDHHLENTIVLLERTPAAFDALLRGLPDMWTETNEGENSWTVSTVVAHLVHGEHENWIPRARAILESGQGQPLPPFDRQRHERYSKGRTMDQLLVDFASARAESLRGLHDLKLTPQDLARRGRHPALGAVTMSQLLATWAAHDLTHLHQISRIMAHQYREAVGPWVRFLGVMHCAGHSAGA